ncbi:hypothetical protein AB205_0043050 [Aquarana catesbeiana]|uniref:Annexin n=1 Tax=Aquarana catesbeiana TaxID=8400 RepID=A0A2G9RK46_AQUCT|nr:hypothetical protein AB205_0043050 [Aquarana catesbeiana]
MDLELKGDIEKLLTAIEHALLHSLFNHLTLKGSGTKHRALIRNVVSHSENEMNDIRPQYKRMFTTALRQAVLVI